MDIGSKNGYPSSALSNFSPHPFTFDGVACSSMEGLLQAFKFSNHEMQKHICTLVGIKAKRAGSKKRWQRDQTLWWKGVPYKRDSDEYQQLLNRAYDALATNEGFCRALIASGNATLEHSIGRTKENETVLTRQEFCSRLSRIRERMMSQK